MGGWQVGTFFSFVALAVVAFLAAGRTIAGAALGLQLAEGRKLASMSVRTATVQFGYLLGTVIGGLVLPVWGFAGVWFVFAGLFALAGIVHIRTPSSKGAPLRSASAVLRRH
ncbi:MAG: hypothetical protein WBM90_13375 [Acidimicrobiia bacterium]